MMTAGNSKPSESMDISQRIVLWLSVAMSVAVLGWKTWLIGQYGFHWDEFWFLSQIHIAWRHGASLLPGAFYLVVLEPMRMMGDEIMALRMGRAIMLILLAASAWLLYRLARYWTRPAAAAFGVSTFLLSWPVLVSGGNFRVDSLLLPLELGALLMLAGERASWKPVLAGLLLGLAFAFSPKIMLMAPVVIAAWWAGLGVRRAGPCLADCGVLALTAAAAAMVCWLAQALLVPHAPSTGGAGASSIWAAMMGAGWLPQGGVALYLANKNILLVVVLGLGAALAAWKKPALSGLVLALAPILLYRNSYNYFYVLMLAPACVLASFLMQWLLSRRQWGAVVGPFSALAIFLQAAWSIGPLDSWQHQHDQKRVLEIVHQAFPQPIAYIDNSGVLAGFNKTNPFMSTWGGEEYLEAGVPFMPGAIRKGAALMLMDRDTLLTGMNAPGTLLPIDRKLLKNSYVPWWGPIWVAGRRIPQQDGRMTLPMAGTYRLESLEPLRMDGTIHHGGDILQVSQIQARNGLRIEWEGNSDPKARLVWATGRPAPQENTPSSFFHIR